MLEVLRDPRERPAQPRGRRDERALAVVSGPRPVTPNSLAVAVYARSPAIRAGLRELLESAGLEVTGQSGPGAPLPDADVLVLDAPDGVESDIASISAGAEVDSMGLVLLVDSLPADALSLAGDSTAARGWLRRDASEAELAAAVIAVGAGLTVIDPLLERRPGGEAERAALTDREREVLSLVALGMTNRAIALALGISEHTAKFHVGAVLAKLQAQSRAEAVSVALRLGILAL